MSAFHCLSEAVRQGCISHEIVLENFSQPELWKALEIACSCGHLKVAEQIQGHIVPAAKGKNPNVFLQSYCNGRVDSAKWLYDTFGATDEQIYRLAKKSIKKGHTSLAKWVYESFTEACQSYYNDYGIYGGEELLVLAALKNDNETFIQWFYTQQPLLLLDRTDSYFARHFVQLCIQHGSVRTLKWWVELRWKRDGIAVLTREKVIARDNELFLIAAKAGHLFMMQWLHKEFDLCTWTILATLREALYISCKLRHPEMASWLVKTFPCLSGIPKKLKRACKNALNEVRFSDHDIYFTDRQGQNA